MSAQQLTQVSYGLSQPLINQPASPIVSTRDPNSDDKAAIGTLWINKSTNIGYVMTSVANNQANWSQITLGAISSPGAFYAFLTTSLSNFTGNGLATALFDTVLFDTGSGYSPGTGTYTAPQSGYYIFTFSIQVNNLQVNHTIGGAFINSFGGGNGTSVVNLINPYAVSQPDPVSATQSMSFSGSTIVYLSSGQSTFISVNVDGGAD